MPRQVEGLHNFIRRLAISKRYNIVIRREMVCTEEVHAIIVAKTKQEAREIAEGIGDGVPPDWPAVDRYNVARQTDPQFNLLDVELMKDAT